MSDAEARSRRHDQFVDVRAGRDDGGRERFDQVGDAGIRKPLPDRAQRRRGEDDVADFAQSNEQDVQSSIVASSMSITGMSSLIG